MGYLEKYRIFVPELRRSLHIAKYRNEQKSARFHIVTYIIKANAQLLDFQSKSKLERVSFLKSEAAISLPNRFLQVASLTRQPDNFLFFLIFIAYPFLITSYPQKKVFRQS